LSTKIEYGIGEIAGSVRLVIFGLFLFYFYTTVMGLPGTLVGVASTIGLVWNAVIDPAIGHLSDRISGPLGRRHGFMLIGSLVTGIAFFALFSPPRGLSTELLFAWLVGTGLVVRLAGSLFGIPYRALGAELTNDYDERSSVSGIRGACGLAGYIIVAALVFVVFFPNRPGSGDPKLNYAAYPTMALAFGGLMIVVNLISTFSTIRYRSRSGDVAVAARPPLAFRQGVLAALGNRAFRVLWIGSSLIWLGLVINTLLFVHFVTYYVQISDSRALTTLQLTFYGCAIIAVPLWLRVSRRLEKRWLFAVPILAAALLLIAARQLVGAGHPFGTGDLRPLVVGEGLAGLFTSLFWIVPQSMMADVVDADELRTGVRREGMFFGLASFGDQVASGVSVLATGFLLDRYAGLVPGQAIQSSQTVERIGVLYGVIPAAILVVAAILLLRYPLDRKQMALIQERLATIRQSGGQSA
jgi:GPH family glycoside/pentoside/hexuronide:cation symporter